MHCPHCRLENAATTRFCTSCGAVLVESTSDGGRRRVLRPWGLRSIAPLTESPAMPEVAAAHVAAQDGNSRPPGRRLDLVFAVGVAVAAVAGMLAYPYANADESRTVAYAPGVTIESTVDLPAVSAVRETRLTAPPLAEPRQGQASRTPPVLKPRAAPAAASESRDASSRAGASRGELAMPVAYPAAARDLILGDGQSVDPSVPMQIAEPMDRWQPLRDALAACAAQSGVLARAVCEERARIAGCDSYWGHVALCPAARSDSAR